MTSVTDIIKSALKERGITQRAFAEAMGITPSHLSDVFSGRRRVTVKFAQETNRLLQIPANLLLGLQADNDTKATDEDNEIDKAKQSLEELDKSVCVKTLLKRIGNKFSNSVDKLKVLVETYNLNPDKIELMRQEYNGCFRKSSTTGMDMRMIFTWLCIVHAAAEKEAPSGRFSVCHLSSLSSEVSKIIHRNSGLVLYDLKKILSEHGIGLLRVDKVDRASVDGYSFFKNGKPYIALTCRYDRIDNLAFTLLHEIGHLALGHTTPETAQINIDRRSYDEELSSKLEDEANKYAADYLIDPNIWQFAPTMPWNPSLIQKKYSEWAGSLGKNPWIILGRLSYETGIYKFKSDNKRAISGGKEVVP